MSAGCQDPDMAVDGAAQAGEEDGGDGSHTRTPPRTQGHKCMYYHMDHTHEHHLEPKGTNVCITTWTTHTNTTSNPRAQMYVLIINANYNQCVVNIFCINKTF